MKTERVQATLINPSLAHTGRLIGPRRVSPNELMTASFPELYKADVLKAIDTIELEKVGQAIDILKRARDEDRRIFVCGNGGSAIHCLALCLRHGQRRQFPPR